MTEDKKIAATNLKDIAHDVQRDNPHLGSKADVEHLLKCSFAVMLERVAAGGQLKLRGFGVFEAKTFKGRTLKSPLMEDQGGEIEFPDQLVLRFRQSQAAKKLINETAASFKQPSKKKAAAKKDTKKAAAKKDTKKAAAKKPATKKAAAKKPDKKAAAKKKAADAAKAAKK
jgi:nucleoid DNA-binding protein